MTAGVFTAQTAREMLQAFRTLQASGLLRPGVVESLIRGGPLMTTTPVYVTNVSGETIPAYACMQVTGTAEIGDQNYLQVSKPADTDGTAGAFVFNGPREIPSTEQGVAQYSYARIVRAYKNTGTVTAGDKWQPVSGQWYIEQDDNGQFTACGEDDVDTNVLKVALDADAGGGIQFYLTPSGGIPARSGSTLGSATCTLLSLDSGTRTVTATTRTVYNDFLSAVGGSVDIAAALVDGIWVVIAEDCT